MQGMQQLLAAGYDPTLVTNMARGMYAGAYDPGTMAQTINTSQQAFDPGTMGTLLNFAGGRSAWSPGGGFNQSLFPGNPALGSGQQINPTLYGSTFGMANPILVPYLAAQGQNQAWPQAWPQATAGGYPGMLQNPYLFSWNPASPPPPPAPATPPGTGTGGTGGNPDPPGPLDPPGGPGGGPAGTGGGFNNAADRGYFGSGGYSGHYT